MGKSKSIDVRIMKLNKWYVPKSVDLRQYNMLVALGYFDALEVDGLEKPVNPEKMHPFTAGYRQLADWKVSQKEKLVDFSSQEQMLFLNIHGENELDDGTSFSEDAVKEFWEYEDKNCEYLYLSMIHISQSNQLNETLGKIKRVFKENYLSYISFDYCDIVIFARNMQIGEFLSKIRNLLDVDGNKKNPIFDSFSMVCFWSQYSWEKSVSRLEIKEAEANDQDSFYATINLSIRDQKKFWDWHKSIMDNQTPQPQFYNLYGRYDISITNERANTDWLMWMMDSLHKKENQEIYWTFETFIKMQFDSADDKSDTEISVKYESERTEESEEQNKEKTENDILNETYEIVSEKLKEEINALKVKLNAADVEDRNRYILPIYEVRDCICSIIKNNFAEEFICCIYESFLHFVSYMKDKFEKLDPDSEKYNKKRINLEVEIAESYDKYFAALNTLVNSTMHTERQFVQATAFNAVFCSVPPKIIAFYNAYIYRIKQILIENGNKRRYTFLIYPSFSPTIFLEQISLVEEPPCDRMLTVSINEKSLYDIESVMYQMVHELAHYVGNALRCRDKRSRKIGHTLIKWIIAECEVDHELYQVMQLYFEKRLKETEYDYLQYLFIIGQKFLETLIESEELPVFMKEYYENRAKKEEDFYDGFLEDCGIKKESQRNYVLYYTAQYADMKCNILRKNLQKISRIDKAREFRRYMSIIKSVYRECYADLQMILVLAMNAKDYLNTFIDNKNISMKDILSRPEDMIRLSTVFRVMIDSKIWEKPDENEDEIFRNAFELFNGYNERVQEETEKELWKESQRKLGDIWDAVKKYDSKDSIKLKKSTKTEDYVCIDVDEAMMKIVPLSDLAADLYNYLLDVLNVSLKEYFDGKKIYKIRELRSLVKKILDFSDITEIFNCVESELKYYKKEGCEISK